MASLVKMLTRERSKRKPVAASSPGARARAQVKAAAQRLGWPEFIRRRYRNMQARRSYRR